MFAISELRRCVYEKILLGLGLLACLLIPSEDVFVLLGWGKNSNSPSYLQSPSFLAEKSRPAQKMKTNLSLLTVSKEGTTGSCFDIYQHTDAVSGRTVVV